MNIVININNNEYEQIKKDAEKFRNKEMVVPYLYKVIESGTPLPEEYGDLVDRDAINNRYYDIWKELESYSNKPSQKELLDKLSMCLDTAEPVIKGNYEEVEEELWR